MHDPLLSVIVCTFNRASLLTKCLDSLAVQSYDPTRWEVLVVDNNCTDNTPEVVARYSPRIPSLRCVFEAQQGLSHARNRGCAEARGEYLVYLDDDAIAPPGYLSAIAQVITKHAPDIMGGPVYPYYTSKKPRWFRDEYEIKKYETCSKFSTTCGVTGANYIIRRIVLERLGLFDATLGMKGDRIGMMEERMVLEAYRQATSQDEQKVYYSLECPVAHHVPPQKMTLAYMMKRGFVGGQALFAMDAKVKGEPGWVESWGGLRHLLGGTRSVVFGLYGEIRSRGAFRADYVKWLVILVWHIGYAWAHFMHVLRKGGLSATT